MIVLRFQRVTLIVSHQLTRPDDRGVTHGRSGQTDARKETIASLPGFGMAPVGHLS